MLSSDDSDDDNMMRPVLPVCVGAEEVSLHEPPKSAAEYLRQVKCAWTVVALAVRRCILIWIPI